MVAARSGQSVGVDALELTLATHLMLRTERQRSCGARDRRDRWGASHKLGESLQVLCDRRESELERCAARAP